MTQISSAQHGNVTNQMKQVAKEEPISLQEIRKRVAAGQIVIPWNPNHHPKPVGLGKGLKVKVNANIGTSREYCKPEEEIEKAKVSLDVKTDAIMDLSTGGNLNEIRKQLLNVSTVPFGTVPIYQTAIESAEKHGAIIDMTSDEMFNTFEQQAKQGVDFAVVHVGVTKESVKRLKHQKRLIPMVSRGGAFHMAWILHHEQENPLYKEFDHLLDIAKEYDVTLSLGDGMRSGALADSNDRAKFQEMLIIGELVEQSRKAGVQAMVEGPGHMPLNDIQSNIEVMKVVTKQAPYFVLGPLVTDIAPGYDHFVGGIGGALAGYFGADFLCYLTPAEHLALPNVNDVREGVIAARIAAHAANLARGIDRNIDYEFSTAREELDWDKMFKLAIDKEKPKQYRKQRLPLEDTHSCTMCGNLCAIELVEKYLKQQE
ncbi:MAG: phosphomethylpyrimidine synthase ThiC [Candidatus Thermoplasmatota archaeon]|nr:phosphomethylpyrimidine synthase ThiC [Candidatus Thermoplasmatota archaeon]MBS3802053.1 phosphomethylpyrimidine synthase ThiC [Candidatus Thermoplasmatota archaeon]